MENTQAESNPTEPNTDDDINIKPSKEYLMELKNNAYHGMFNEDVVDHIAKVLELLDLIKIPGVDSHQLQMKIFPLSLADDARQWEDEMLNEGDNWGIDPFEFISRVNSSFENHMKVDGRTKKKESDYGNPFNTAIDSFFKAHDEHDIEEGKELRQMKRKEDNKNDEQPNKRVYKAEKFEAIKYSLGPNEEYIAIKRCEYNAWERNKDKEQAGFTLIRRILKGRYGVSVPTLHKKPRRTEQLYAVSRRIYTPYPKSRYKDSGRYQTWSLLQEISNTPYPTSPDMAYRPVSRTYKYKTLNSVLVSLVGLAGDPRINKYVLVPLFHIPNKVHPVLPNQNDTMHERPAGKIRFYTRFFDYANFRLPLSTFLVDVLRHLRINISQLSVIGAAKSGWMSFSKRSDNAPHVIRNPAPVATDFNARYYATLVAHPSPFRKFPEAFLCLEWNEGEPLLLETTIGRTVPLLPIAPDHAESELEASVDRLFDEGGSGNQTEQGDSAGGGKGANIQPVSDHADTVIEDVAPLQPRRQRKRKTMVVDVGESSHPPKRAVLNAEVRVAAIPTLPFVTASVSTTLEHKGGDHIDSVAGPNLRTIGAPQRFVISSDSSHHSGVNVAKAEVDSLVRSSVPIMTTATTVTPMVDPTLVAKEKLVEPSPLFVGSSSAGGTDPTMGGFSDLTGSDFLVGGIRTVIDPDTNLQKVTDLEASMVGKERDLTDLNAQLTSVKSQNDNLADRVHKLEISSAGLQEKITVYDNCMEQLEKFQDDRMKVVNDKLARLDADLAEIACHLEERFYPHILNTISGRRWLLTHGLKLFLVKCLNSSEYLTALGAAISRAIEKGMQSGLAADIDHGREGRSLADVAIYNPDAEADFNSAL
ncbi:hypothetical protein Tco_1540495 [Tanacetum coccineum]